MPFSFFILSPSKFFSTVNWLYSSFCMVSMSEFGWINISNTLMKAYSSGDSGFEGLIRETTSFLSRKSQTNWRDGHIKEGLYQQLRRTIHNRIQDYRVGVGTNHLILYKKCLYLTNNFSKSLKTFTLSNEIKYSDFSQILIIFPPLSRSPNVLAS